MASEDVIRIAHFRRYKVSNHPALIVEEHSADEYAYRKVTHSEKEGRHLNEKVDPNPNPRNPEPMYIVKRVRHDKKKNFSSWKYPWSYPGQKKKERVISLLLIERPTGLGKSLTIILFLL